LRVPWKESRPSAEGKVTPEVVVDDETGTFEVSGDWIEDDKVGFRTTDDRGGTISIYSGPIGPVGLLARISLNAIAKRPLREGIEEVDDLVSG
jgi:hypothetical protein